jgi:regulatory protein YycI of two-component signal transduction system YycFG
VVTCEPKKLWEASGIDSSKFLYKTDLGQSLYKYSIYVLGGLAVKHEIKKKNSDKFLKALCRMYHGEEYTLENLDSESRAIDF